MSAAASTRLRGKLSFLQRVLWQRLAADAPRQCPYCRRQTNLRILGRKKLILDVCRCEECGMIFRWPLETEPQLKDFYEHAYREGEITWLPAPETLPLLLGANFRGTALDLSARVELLRALRPAGRVLDYGCSWGYGVHQLRVAGYEASGFEISRTRARFGRAQLNVAVLDDPRELQALPQGSFDVIFSNHVVEHIISLKDVLRLFAHLLPPSGLLLLVLPNFTGKRAREGAFISWIGEAHPLAPTADFFRKNLPGRGFVNIRCASSPFDGALLERVRGGRFEEANLDGDELLVVAERSPA